MCYGTFNRNPFHADVASDKDRGACRANALRSDEGTRSGSEYLLALAASRDSRFNLTDPEVTGQYVIR